jgi:putative hemolysin
MGGIQFIFAALMPVCLAASAVCSSSETALFSMSQADRMRLRRVSPVAYDAVVRLLASPRSLLIAVLLGNTTVNSAYYVLAAATGTAFFGPLGAVGFGVASLVVMIVAGEVLPKSIAASHRVTFCRLLARPLLWWYLLISPVHGFAERFLISPLVRVLTPRSAGQADGGVSADELAAVLEQGARSGVLESEEQRLMGEVVRLGGVRVREIMTPRVDVGFLASGSTAADVIELVRAGNATKFPLSRGDLTAGSVVGFVSAERVIAAMSKDARGIAMPVDALVEPVRFVPDGARLDQLLDHFRSTRSDIAMCVNETGELTGVVQLDSVIAELVGVGVGSSSEAAADQEVRMIGLGAWDVPGRLGVRDWADFFGDRSIASDRRVTTVGGVIIAKLGRLPRVGDECQLGDLKLRVETMDGRMVDRVLVTLVRDQPPEARA